MVRELLLITSVNWYEKASEQQNLKENSDEKSKGIISRESILKSAKIIAQKESYAPKKEHSKDNSL